MVGFIAVLEQTPQLQQFWCANSKKNPNIDREIEYLDFVSGHLASTETQWPKKSQVTKSIQVASSTSQKLYEHKYYMWAQYSRYTVPTLI